MTHAGRQINGMLYPEIDAGYQAWAVMRRIERESPLNQFLIACRRAVENPEPERWQRVCRRWGAKHR